MPLKFSPEGPLRRQQLELPLKLFPRRAVFDIGQQTDPLDVTSQPSFPLRLPCCLANDTPHKLGALAVSRTLIFMLDEFHNSVASKLHHGICPELPIDHVARRVRNDDLLERKDVGKHPVEYVFQVSLRTHTS